MLFLACFSDDQALDAALEALRAQGVEGFGFSYSHGAPGTAAYLVCQSDPQLAGVEFTPLSSVYEEGPLPAPEANPPEAIYLPAPIEESDDAQPKEESGENPGEEPRGEGQE